MHFDNIEVKYKYLIDINEMDYDKIEISHKVSYSTPGFKYFIRYNDDEKVKPLSTLSD